ncbi:MAG: hypothetical protein Q9166_006993 [cf. Caloplaca sp. 2 TL-2023]
MVQTSCVRIQSITKTGVRLLEAKDLEDLLGKGKFWTRWKERQELAIARLGIWIHGTMKALFEHDGPSHFGPKVQGDGCDRISIIVRVKQRPNPAEGGLARLGGSPSEFLPPSQKAPPHPPIMSVSAVRRAIDIFMKNFVLNSKPNRVSKLKV